MDYETGIRLDRLEQMLTYLIEEYEKTKKETEGELGEKIEPKK